MSINPVKDSYTEDELAAIERSVEATFFNLLIGSDELAEADYDVTVVPGKGAQITVTGEFAELIWQKSNKYVSVYAGNYKAEDVEGLGLELKALTALSAQIDAAIIAR